MSGRDGGSGVRGGWPVKLGDIMAGTLERLGPGGLWTEARLRKAWRDAVGEEVAAHAHVRRLRGDVLDVSVTTDVWATELTYLTPAIIERLNEQLGVGTVKQIVVGRARRERSG